MRLGILKNRRDIQTNSGKAALSLLREGGGEGLGRVGLDVEESLTVRERGMYGEDGVSRMEGSWPVLV